MKKMRKLTGQQIKFIINMLSIMLFAVSYLYIYTGYVEKMEAAYDEIELQKKQIEAIENKLSKEDEVKRQIEEVDMQINDIIDNYPVKIAKADGHLFVEHMQEELGISFTSIDVKEDVPFYKTILPIRNEEGAEVDSQTGTDAEKPQQDTSNSEASPSEGTEAESEKSKPDDQLAEIDKMTAGNTAKPSKGNKEDDTPKITGMETTILMNFTATYQEFKDLVAYIADDASNAIVDSASISVDSTTGKLTGSLVIKCFALSGTGKVYEPPMIEDITIGTDNIFGIGGEKKDEEALSGDQEDVQY